MKEKPKQPTPKSEEFDFSGFVPNSLNKVYEKLGISAAQEKITNREEKRILSLLRKDAETFVPNDLSYIEQACGTVRPLETQEALAFNEKMKNETSSLFAESKKDILSKAGVKGRSPFLTSLFSPHGLALTGGIAAALALVIVIPLLNNNTSSIVITPADGSTTYVSVTVTPSSKIKSEGVSALKAVDNSSGSSSTSENTYTPKGSFSVNTDGQYEANTLTAKNYSATQVISSIDISKTNSIFDESATLLQASYDTGYLETKDKNYPNSIAISLVSSDSVYANSQEVKKAFLKKISSFLEENQIYSEVTFPDTTSITKQLSAFAAEHDSALSDLVFSIYDKLSLATSASFETYANCLVNESESFLNILNESLDLITKAPLSEDGQIGLLNAIDLTMQSRHSLIDVSSPFINELDYENFRERLESHFRFLENDQFFFYSNASAEDYQPVTREELGELDLSKSMRAIRDYMITTECGLDDDKFTDILQRINQGASICAKNPEDDDGLYDPNKDDRDPGGWHHGNGPDEDDWGDGGVWGDEDDDHH